MVVADWFTGEPPSDEFSASSDSDNESPCPEHAVDMVKVRGMNPADFRAAPSSGGAGGRWRDGVADRHRTGHTMDLLELAKGTRDEPGPGCCGRDREREAEVTDLALLGGSVRSTGDGRTVVGPRAEGWGGGRGSVSSSRRGAPSCDLLLRAEMPRTACAAVAESLAEAVSRAR